MNDQEEPHRPSQYGDVSERPGLVRHDDIADFIFSGCDDDVEGKGSFDNSGAMASPGPGVPAAECDTVTIGEALEASALSAGNKAVDHSDAAAIQAAEARAMGAEGIRPGGVAAEAQSAADFNAKTERDEDKTKIADVLTDATEKLGKDKPVTKGDAEGVIGAELRNNPNLATFPDGVAETMAAAAGLNNYK